MATLPIISISMPLFLQQIVCPESAIKKVKINYLNTGNHLESVFRKKMNIFNLRVDNFWLFSS